MGARLVPGSVGPVWCWVGQPELGVWVYRGRTEFWIILVYTGEGWCLGLWQGWVLTALSFPSLHAEGASLHASLHRLEEQVTQVVWNCPYYPLQSIFHFCAPPKCCNFMGMVVQISMRQVLFHNLRMLLLQFTIFDMYTLLWFFTFMTTNSMQNNYNISRNSLMHPLSIQTPLIPGKHWYILDIYIFTFSIMYKWNHKVCDFLRLVSSLMLHVSVVRFFCCCSWVILSGYTMVCPFIHWRTFGLFQFLVIINNTIDTHE